MTAPKITYRVPGLVGPDAEVKPRLIFSYMDHLWMVHRPPRGSRFPKTWTVAHLATGYTAYRNAPTVELARLGVQERLDKIGKVEVDRAIASKPVLNEAPTRISK